MAARLQKLRESCIELSHKVAGPDGFVRVCQLAKELGVRINARPLLVEATLASLIEYDGPGSPWVILVDNDRFRLTAADINGESVTNPLPTRLRSTIAHELLHAMTMHAGDEGFSPDLPMINGESRKDYLQRVERETKKFTPLLLIPEESIAELARKPQVVLSDIMSFRKTLGVSRDILTNRFALIKRSDARLHNSGLSNTALGTISRDADGEWQLDSWPLFMNFDDCRFPWFLTRLASRQPLRLQSLINDPSFVVNGGDTYEAHLKGHDEQERFDYMKMNVHLAVEPFPIQSSRKFLFFVRKVRYPAC